MQLKMKCTKVPGTPACTYANDMCAYLISTYVRVALEERATLAKMAENSLKFYSVYCFTRSSTYQENTCYNCIVTIAIRTVALADCSDLIDNMATGKVSKVTSLVSPPSPLQTRDPGNVWQHRGYGKSISTSTSLDQEELIYQK